MFSTVVNVEERKINEKKIKKKKSVVNGYVSMDNAAAVRKEVTKLCSKLWHSPFKWINANA